MSVVFEDNQVLKKCTELYQRGVAEIKVGWNAHP
jgi:hypothetical protein